MTASHEVMSAEDAWEWWSARSRVLCVTVSPLEGALPKQKVGTSVDSGLDANVAWVARPFDRAMPSSGHVMARPTGLSLPRQHGGEPCSRCV